MPFTFDPLDIGGAQLITPAAFADERGFFMETYKRSDFARAGIGEHFVQQNLSYSRRGVLRGLHFQEEPAAQAKLVSVLSGEIFDVLVDLRRDGVHFGRWAALTLSAEKRQLLYVPPWCAHGFCVLSEDAYVLYAVTREYAPELERGITWDDPALAIPWPVRVPILSERDRTWPPLRSLAGNADGGVPSSDATAASEAYG
jgi:dTDP-4-dehydrorhamnose 3,5-epimerase